MRHMLFALAGVGVAGFAFAQQAPIPDWLRGMAGVIVSVRSRRAASATATTAVAS